MLSNSLGIFTLELQRIMDSVFSTLTKTTLCTIKEEWAIKTNNFSRSFSNIIQRRKSLSNHLKYRLSHPQYANELQLLDGNADIACNDVRILMKNFTTDIQNSISNVLEKSLDKLEYAVASFTGLLDGMVFTHHIQVPGTFL